MLSKNEKSNFSFVIINPGLSELKKNLQIISTLWYVDDVSFDQFVKCSSSQGKVANVLRVIHYYT